MNAAEACKLDRGPDSLRVENLVVDTTLDYAAIGGLAYCRLRIYRQGDTHLVVFTEEPGNDGTSVINWIEELASLVATARQLRPVDTLWFDHHAPGYYQAHGAPWEAGEEQISMATFDWRQRASKYRASDVAWAHIYSKRHPTAQQPAIEALRNWLLDDGDDLPDIDLVLLAGAHMQQAAT